MYKEININNKSTGHPITQMHKTREKLKNNLFEITQTSATYGVPNFFRTNRLFFKLMWFFYLISAASLSAYYVTQSVIYYFQYDIITKVTAYDEFPAPFPAVAICNINPFTTNYSVEFSRKVFDKYNLSYSIVAQNFTKKKFLTYKYFLQTHAKDPKFSDENKKKLGFQLEDILITCLFELETCSAEDFEWFFDLEYGNCWIFNNKNKSKSITRSGRVFGLRLELYVGVSEKLSFKYFYQSIGARVFLFNQTGHRKLLTSVAGVEVSAGAETNIVIDRKFITKTERPYSECVSKLNTREAYDSEIYKKYIDLQPEIGYYNRLDCMDLCYQQHLNTKCNCSDLHMPSYDDKIGICLNLSEIICNQRFYISFIQTQAESCLKECPLECDSTLLSLTLSSSDYPTRSYAEMLAQNGKFNFTGESLTYEDVKNSILALNIYYDELKYTQVEEIKKIETFDLISNLGGIMGLFLGVSFVSFFEIFEILLETFFILCEDKILNTKVSGNF